MVSPRLDYGRPKTLRPEKMYGTHRAGPHRQDVRPRPLEGAGAAGHPLPHRARGVRGHRRSVGLRQVDADEHHRLPRRADRRPVPALRARRQHALGRRAGRRAEPRDRIRLPELPASPPRQRAGERRAASRLPRRQQEGAPRPRRRGAEAGGTRGSDEAQAGGAFRRPAAAGGDRACPRDSALAAAGRRAHRQPRQPDRRGDRRALPRPARPRQHHPAGDARAEAGGALPARRPAGGWSGDRGRARPGSGDGQRGGARRRSAGAVPCRGTRGAGWSTAMKRIRRFLAELRDAIVQAAFSLVSHKLRALLTISGIAIGIMTVILIFMVESGMSASFARQLSTLGPNTLFVHKWKWGVSGNDWWKYKNRPHVNMLDLRALQQNTTLPVAIAPLVNTQATVSHGGKDVKGVDVRGTTDGYLDATGWQIRRGRFITALDQEIGANACIIGADIEDAFFKGQEPLGQQVRVGPNMRCDIVGIFARKGNAFGQTQDLRVVLPLSSFIRTFGSKRGLVVAVVAPEGKVRETEDEVTAVMRNARHLAPDQEENFSVNRQDKLLEGFEQMMKATNITGILVGIITAIVAGVGIMNILLVSVKERTREIGIRRAVGARRATLLWQFLCEALMVALVGGAGGIALASGAASIIDLISPLPARVDPRVMLGGVIGSAVLGVGFGLWPALTAAMLQPVEALRYE